MSNYTYKDINNLNLASNFVEDRRGDHHETIFVN
jgi:hypothetical protein